MAGTLSSTNTSIHNQIVVSHGLYTLIRWALGTVFIFAGGAKLGTPESFATLIDAYGIIPEGLLMPVALVLPVFEVAAGLGLLFNIRGSLVSITVLLMLFIAILGYGLWLGLDVDCGCFGPEDPEADAFHGLKSTLYRDLIMLAGILYLFFWRRYRAIKTLNLASIMNRCFQHRRIKNG